MSLGEHFAPTRSTGRSKTLAGGLASLWSWLSQDGWMTTLAIVLIVIPPLVLIIPLVTHHGLFSNWGDGAAAELSVQNAVRLHQTLGPYDRFGWNHPGPLNFYLLAIPYALMSWNGAALPVGAALINLVAGVGIVVLLARRCGGKAALGTAAVLCAFEFILRAPNIENAWGPYLIVVPAALFFVFCADVATGRAWSIVGAVIVGSFLLQTDITTGAGVVAALVLAACVPGLRWLRAGSPWAALRHLAWPGVAALAAGAVIWAPPLWQQLSNSPGNLGVLVTFFRTHNGRHTSAHAFTALAGGMLQRSFGGLVDLETGRHDQVGLVLLLAGAVGLALLCWWRQQWLGCTLAGGIPLVALAVWLSLLRVQGGIFGYLVVWTRALTLCGAIAVVICVTSPAKRAILPTTWSDRARLAGAIVLAGCAVASSWRLANAAHRFKPGGGYANVTQATLAVERLVPPNADRLLVCITSPAAWPTSAGVVANLWKAGRDARVNPHWLYIFGHQLAPTGREQVAVFLESTTRRPPPLPQRPVSSTTGGGLSIRVYQPAHGYVTAAACPAVTSG